MRVIIVNPGFYVYGGAERLIVKLGNHLTDKGIPNTIITPSIIPEIRKALTETRIIETGVIENLVPILHSVASEYDVVNPHNDPAQLTTFPRRLPSVWMCNEPPIQVLSGGQLDSKSREVVRNHVDIIVVADDYNKRRAADIYGDDLDIRVNHYGVDYDFFAEGNPEAVKEKYGLDGFTVLQVGMLTFTKNQLKTLSIFKKIKKQVPDAKLVLAGFNETPYYQDVNKRIVSGRLRRDVVVTGNVPQSEVRDLMHACDVVVVPIMPQGGWLSTFEAIAAGKPVVVSKEMTAASIIEEHNLGVVTDDFVEEIIKIHDTPFGNYVGQAWVKGNLSWPKFCERMTSFFEDTVP